MKVFFRYSIKEELKEVLSFIFHRKEYENLRSVIKPSIGRIVYYCVSKRKILLEVSDWWQSVAKPVEKAFKQLELVLPNKNTVCYVHSFSNEGWFNENTGNINARHYLCGGRKEFVETVIHELIHITIYKDTHSYDESEKIVDKYLDRPQLKEILKN